MSRAPNRESSTAPPASGGHPVLQGRFQVDLNAPAGVCDNAATHAFPAWRSAGGEGGPLVALLCTPDLPQRLKAAARLKGKAMPSTLAVVDSGVARYTPEIGRRFTLFLERPSGSRVVPANAERWQALSEHDTVEHVVGPLLDALTAIHREGLVHGGVRPDNLYFSAGRSSAVVLGEGLSTPTGAMQPVAVETIPRGQAIPAARGEGTKAVDYYAFGATLALLLRGSDPTAGQTPEQVVAAKIRDGSYRLLCHGLRVTPSMMQLMRGLLEDEPELRWGRAHVEKWLAGTSVPTANSGRAKLPPLKFADGQHDTPADLAHAFAEHWRDAAKLIRGEALGDWLKHRPEHRGAALDIQALIERDAQSRLADEELTARVIFRLDPTGPLRYRGIAVMWDGLGPGLAAVMAEGKRERIDAFAGLFGSGLHLDYYDHAMRGSTTPSRDRGTLRAQEKNASQQSPGFGLERALYDLNPDLPCRSSLVGDRCVTSVEDLLPALDALAVKQVPAGDPMDDHIAAFIANRLNLTTGNELTGLAAPSTRMHVKRLATVAMLALVHHRRGQPAVPNLAGWLATRLTPVVDQIKNRDRRRQMQERITQVALTGDLSRLLKVAADPGLRKKDEAEFAAAKRRYGAAKQRIHFITYDRGYRERLVNSVGTRIATGVAVAILMVTTVAVVFTDGI